MFNILFLLYVLEKIIRCGCVIMVVLIFIYFERWVIDFLV